MNDKLLAEFLAAGIKKLVEGLKWSDIVPGHFRETVRRVREIADTIEQCGERLTAASYTMSEDVKP